MRWLWLLLLVPTASAGLAEDLEDARDRAVDWLGEGGPDRIRLEAAHIAGRDTRAWPEDPWYGRIAPTDNVRTLHALLSSGYDPAAYPGPDGAVHLGLHLLDQHERVLEQGRAADIAWYLLALHAGGVPANTTYVQEAAAALQATQQRGFPCNQSDISADCTGFAVAALAAYGLPFDDEAVRDLFHLVDGAYVIDGGYAATPNADTQAWSIIAMQQVGHVPESAWRWLTDLQSEDGWFQHQPGDPGPEATWLYPTADAVLALSGFPGPAWMQVTIEPGPSGYRVSPGTNATWMAGSMQHQGAWVGTQQILGDATLLRVHVAGNGTHGRDAIELPAAKAAPLTWWLPLAAVATRLRRD